MSSFYGNGGISIQEATGMINGVKDHIIISKTEPTVQETGDIWFVLTEFSNDEEENDNNG